MAWTYDTVTPTPIPNATVERGYSNGVHKIFRITPNEGYVLHDNAGDWTDIDLETGAETEREAFYRGSCSCGANYDFVANPREFYTVLESGVPADQVFGGVDNDHEVM